MKKQDGWSGPFWNARDQVWFAKYMDDAGKWKTKNLPKDYPHNDRGKRDASAWFKEAIKLYRRSGSFAGEVVVPKTAPVTMEGLVESFLAAREKNPKIRPGTIASNRAALNHHVLTDPIAKVPIVDLLENDGTDTLPAVAYIYRLQKKPIAAHTVRNVHCACSALVSYAIRAKHVPHIPNPWQVEDVRDALPEAETIAGEAIYLPTDLLLDLLTSEDVPLERRALYRVAVFTGLRAGELFGLRWEDVKEIEGLHYLDVSHQAAFYGSEGYCSLDPTKTRNGKRLVPLHPIAQQAIEFVKVSLWRFLVGREPEDNDPIFPDAYGEHQRPKSAELVRRDLGAAALPTHVKGHPVTFHALRRTFVALLEGQAVDPAVIDGLLGHRDRSTRAKNYSNPIVLVRPRMEALLRIDLDVPPMVMVGPQPSGAFIPVLEGDAEAHKVVGGAGHRRTGADILRGKPGIVVGSGAKIGTGTVAKTAPPTKAQPLAPNHAADKVVSLPGVSGDLLAALRALPAETLAQVIAAALQVPATRGRGSEGAAKVGPRARRNVGMP